MINIQNELMIFNIKAFDSCKNACPSCPLTKKQRALGESIDYDAFRRIVEFAQAYERRSDIKKIHFQIGQANCLADPEKLKSFVDLIHGSFDKPVKMEISTTMLEDGDAELASQIMAEDYRFDEMIVETIVDPVVYDKYKDNIKDNFAKIRELDYLSHHIFIRYSPHIKAHAQEVLRKMKFLDTQFRLDFLYDNSFINRFSSESFVRLIELFDGYTSFDEPLMYQNDFNISERITNNPVSGYMIGKDLNLQVLTATPYGDMVQPFPDGMSISSPDAVDQNINSLLAFERKMGMEMVRERVGNSNCSRCHASGSCPSNVIQKLIKENSLSTNIEDCLGGHSFMN